MVIYTMCVDPEQGRYMALSAEDSEVKAISGREEAAVGELVRAHTRIVVDLVIHVETIEKSASPPAAASTKFCPPVHLSKSVTKTVWLPTCCSSGWRSQDCAGASEPLSTTTARRFPGGCPVRDSQELIAGLTCR